MNKPYATEDEAVRTIAASLDNFYRSYYSEIQRIYRTYFFPEMKTDWQTHPNDIGHLYFAGCFAVMTVNTSATPAK